jgi:hypothetical protein
VIVDDLPSPVVVNEEETEADSDWSDVDEEDSVVPSPSIHITPAKPAAAAKATPKKDGDKKPFNAFFKPCDMRAPILLVPLRDCPPDFMERYDKYRDELFVASLESWPVRTVWFNALIHR